MGTSSRTWNTLSALAIPAAALSILASPAWGQYARRDCRILTDDQERLACYDALSGRTPRERVGERDRRGADDRPRLGERPRLDDRRRVEERPGPDDGSGVTEVLRATYEAGDLTLSCKDNKTEVAIKPRGFVSYAGAPARVTYRIGQGAPVQSQWLASNNGRTLFARSPIEFIKALPDRGKLFVRVYDWDGGTHHLQFELSDVSTLRDRLAEACQWDGPPKIPAEPTAERPAIAPPATAAPAPEVTPAPEATPAPAVRPAVAATPDVGPKGQPRRIRQN